MVMSSWMIRNMRSKSRPLPEDCYRLDLSKKPIENAYDIYLGLSSRTTSENKRLNLLNALAILISKNRNENLGFTIEEFFYVVSANFTHQLTQIRAASLRVIRHIIARPSDVQVFNTLQLPHLVCRSLDILLKNEEERVQALKLVRRILAVAPDQISPVLARCLIALGESGVEDGDRMLRACLAILCEFGVLNPIVLIMCGGVSVITRNVLECHSPRIAESLCGVLLHLLEYPNTRNIAGVRLDCLAAPYCDFTYRLGIMDKNKDARDLRFTCSRLALLSVLRSWAGVIEFCDPNRPSGLKAIVDVLYLNQLEVRKAILDLLYELLGLPQPQWTDEYNVALAVVDPADYQDSWRLGEGFVAMEGRFVLPSLANNVPNICEIHTAILLYCFLETGLLNALVEVIVSSDTFISVRATVLLGKLLQMMHSMLPADLCLNSSALPTLIAQATEGKHQARAAISALQNFHQMLKNRPAACSLFLDNIIQSGSIINEKIFRREINVQDNLFAPIKQNSSLERRRHDSVSSNASTTPEPRDDIASKAGFLSGIKRSSFRRSKIINFFDGLKEPERMLRLSNVLTNQDGATWDWEIITAILKSDSFSKIDDSHSKFIRRLIQYFKPSNNRFSHQDLGHGRHIQPSVTAGVDLIDMLLASNQELESLRLLTDLFTDISGQLLAISTSKSAHECLFSPQHMASTMCQQYFIFIGRMCKTEKGLSILKNTNVVKQLEDLIESTNHVCYIKLIVSGLDYSLDSYPRNILGNALRISKLRTGRLYATQFMLILLRAKLPNFEVWGIPLLINQLRDPDKSVVIAALEILDEACHEHAYLEEIISLWPNFEEHSHAGKLIMTRFYSLPRGLNHPKAKIRSEIELWQNEYNKRYVLLVEADTHASLTLHYKNEDGSYNRRNCSSRPTIFPPNILPHLYGQLVQTQQGLNELQMHGNVPQLIQMLGIVKCDDESECLAIKSALWAIGHVCTSTEGIECLNDPVSRVFEKIIYLAKYSDVYSVRSTAVNVLGLVGSTNAGANALYKFDWYCVRHNRSTYWPVYEPEDWLLKHLTPIRHQLVEMAPYNYAGIEEGDFYSDGSNSFFYDENSYESGGGRGGNERNKFVGDDAGPQPIERSRTLTESTIMERRFEPVSLFESKTTDGLSLLAATAQQHQQTSTLQRPRFNSGTDSNTSGVSSCDSIFGKIFVPDHQATTLSPIPSTSNLLELKKSGDDRFRRISLTGMPLLDNTLSPQDLQGYATLRSLRRHCRPMLSESAADELAEIIDNDSIAVRNKKGVYESQRKLKVRSLDRHGRLLSAGVEDFASSSLNVTTGVTRRLIQKDTKGPCYTGICLPKNIYELFPRRNNTVTYVSQMQQPDINDSDDVSTSNKQQFSNDSIIEGEESCVSSMSDVSNISKRPRWLSQHMRSSCLYCCRNKINCLNLRSSDSDQFMMASTSSRRRYTQSSLNQLSDISNSPKSVQSEESNVPERVTTNILRYVQRMSNPVLSKPSKMSLLEMKQKHPQSFQDICLYSEVCKLLGSCTYRLNARRFLQELFLDLDFDHFYNEANEILERKGSLDRFLNEGQQSIISNTNINTPGKTITSTISNGGVEFSTSVTSTVTSLSSPGSGGGALPPLAHMKSHLKSPQLESVYEASQENLSDSISSLKKNDLNSTPSPLTAKLKTQTTATARYQNTNENYKNFRRPRFHTLELDLSCTKNKFPITERRKEFSPTAGYQSRDDYLANFTRNLTALRTAPANTLHCEKRLKSYHSEATLSKSNDDNDTKT